ncbi:MAG: adenylosuccinate lyase [Urechidicola sp.]|nr:adenylosuccinate lyase [Urechidicola sp.]
MNKEALANLINTKVTSYREYRIKYAELVVKDKTLFIPLLELSFDETNEAAIKVSWVLDFVSREKLEWFYPHLDFFTEHISKVKHDSIVRPMARICELLAKAYTSKKDTEIHKYLTRTHIDKIIETGFDWMISDQKVAVKAYTMETLFFFGKEVDWVHEELQLILQQEIINGSPAYKARGKKILKWIDKFDNRR